MGMDLQACGYSPATILTRQQVYQSSAFAMQQD